MVIHENERVQQHRAGLDVIVELGPYRSSYAMCGRNSALRTFLS